VNYTHIRFESDFQPALLFRTGVSLHGHTLHSKESLAFIYRLARQVMPLRFALERGEVRYRKYYGSSMDLSRAWWTPPLSAHQAWKLETREIQQQFDINALVSLTDHDDIEASAMLQLRDECNPVPISVEWTVPWGGTFVHIGVHNLRGDKARAIMSDLAAYTNETSEIPLTNLLETLAGNRDTLIVFNHANWDEKGIGRDTHRTAARQFAANYKRFLHAFELNGLRPWSENRSIFELAKQFGKPLISGGDRHGTEPNTILNLTNAATFPEFVEEIREGFSDILITNQYLEPLTMRILQNLEDILGDHEDHAYGWRHWSDRAFYKCADGVIRSLRETWGEEPLAVRLFTNGIQLLRHPQFKNAFRMAFAKREAVVL